MTRIIDITTPGNPADVPAHLRSLSARCASLANQITEGPRRTDRSAALANFSHYVGGELAQLSRFYPQNIPGLAWSARNLFEINLTVRYVLLSEENFHSWLGQTLQDEKDFIDGIISISSEQDSGGAEVKGIRNAAGEGPAQSAE